MTNEEYKLILNYKHMNPDSIKKIKNLIGNVSKQIRFDGSITQKEINKDIAEFHGISVNELINSINIDYLIKIYINSKTSIIKRAILTNYDEISELDYDSVMYVIVNKGY